MGKTKRDLKGDFNKVVSELENMILTGVFQPRERLIENKLAETLGVSRFWVRDALKVLETKGLVRVIPYKGAVVSDLDEQEIQEIFQVRVALEKLATRLAAERATKADLKVLRRMAKQVEESFRRQDVQEMIASNANFHDFIFKLAGNQTLFQVINQLKARCHITRHIAWSSPEIVSKILEEHRQFITALEARDIDTLEDLAERHISYAKDSYLFQLRARKAAISNSNK